MTPEDRLRDLGWDDDVARRVAAVERPGLVPARVVRVDRGEVDLAVDLDDAHDLRATSASSATDCVAGDWVVVDVDAARVEAVAERRTAFVRRAARGARVPQTLAANLDVVLVVAGLDPGLNPRRLERELVLAHQSGAVPLVVLTKIDLVDRDAVDRAVAAATAAAPGVAVVALSSRTGEGLDDLRSHVATGRTLALLGASGVGKSSLVNALAGTEVQLTAEIRAGDGKGRHTTTAARLLRLGDGHLLLDTPGVRALALWESWDGLAAAFPDVEGRSGRCQFADCYHDDEPGCAVVAAVASGELDPERLENWRRMRDEMVTLDADLVEADRRRRRPGRPGSR